MAIRFRVLRTDPGHVRVSIRVGPDGEPGNTVGLLTLTDIEWLHFKDTLLLKDEAPTLLGDALPYIKDYVIAYLDEFGGCRTCGFTPENPEEPLMHDIGCPVGEAQILRGAIKDVLRRTKTPIEVEEEKEN